jgi:hypothetical protein
MQKDSFLLTTLNVKHLIITLSFFAIVFISSILLTNDVAASDTHSTDFFCGVDVPVESLSIETIIPALYRIVSGDAGSIKNWSLLKKLHAPNAIITPLFHEDGKPSASISSVDKFIALNKKIFKDINFYETEVASRIFTYGHMATILSHYESRDNRNSKPYSQGINSFQLVNDGRRWCVISVTWDSDKGGHPVSSGMLQKIG